MFCFSDFLYIHISPSAGIGHIFSHRKSKTYNITVKMSKIHQDHQDRQQTEYYQELAGERYKIEAKNAELKKEHGYAHTVYAGINGMMLQAGVTIFVVNLKRILKLKKR